MPGRKRKPGGSGGGKSGKKTKRKKKKKGGSDWYNDGYDIVEQPSAASALVPVLAISLTVKTDDAFTFERTNRSLTTRFPATTRSQGRSLTPERARQTSPRVRKLARLRTTAS